jgi:hypothetical protein
MVHTTDRGMRPPATGPHPAAANLAAAVVLIALGIMGYWALGRSAVLINTAVLLAGLTWSARILHDMRQHGTRPGGTRPGDMRKQPRRHPDPRRT